MHLFEAAFMASIEELAANPKSYEIVAKTDQAPEPQQMPAIKIPYVKLFDEKIEQIANQILESTVTIRRGRTHGSGFVISSDGYILTNQHVVASAPEVLVVFNSGMQVPGAVIRTNKTRDVALIQIPIRGMKPLPIADSDQLSRMDQVYAIGTPLTEGLNATITKGIVSAIRTLEENNFYVQIRCRYCRRKQRWSIAQRKWQRCRYCSGEHRYQISVCWTESVYTRERCAKTAQYRINEDELITKGQHRRPLTQAI